MAETNGQNSGSERLDRIERVLELVVDAQKQFTVEHKQLLTAQVLLTDRLDSLVKLTEQRSKETDQRFRDTDDRIGILIKMIDEWIRRNPAPPA